jgi:hypothetical protein
MSLIIKTSIEIAEVEYHPFFEEVTKIVLRSCKVWGSMEYSQYELHCQFFINFFVYGLLMILLSLRDGPI